jgi:uncharacterized membrane protein
MLTWIEASLALLALAVTVALRPWRMLTEGLLTPWLATIVFLPLVWLLPQGLPNGLAVQFSGACLLVLMVGWPLAVLALAVVAVLVWALGALPFAPVLSQLVWVGLMPATLALLLGAALRHWLPPNPFVYVLGRGFLGTAACVFVAGAVQELLYRLVGQVGLEQALVAHWLMAWGDAFLTGMAAAIFVAFAPQWLATWSDARYLRPPD